MSGIGGLDGGLIFGGYRHSPCAIFETYVGDSRMCCGKMSGTPSLSCAFHY